MKCVPFTEIFEKFKISSYFSVIKKMRKMRDDIFNAFPIAKHCNSVFSFSLRNFTSIILGTKP